MKYRVPRTTRDLSELLAQPSPARIFCLCVSAAVIVSILAVTAIASTSSAYVAEHASATLESDRQLDWLMPRARIENGELKVGDAAYESRSGRTFMLTDRPYDEGLWVSDAPGQPPKFLKLPTVGETGAQMIYRIAVDPEEAELWVLLRPDSLGTPLNIARFSIDGGGALALEEMQPLLYGTNGYPLAIDARRGAVAIAYGENTVGAIGHVELIYGNPIRVVARNTHELKSVEITDVAIAPSPGLDRVFIGRKGGLLGIGGDLPRCSDNSCQMLEYPGSSVEAMSSDEAWWNQSVYIVRTDGTGTWLAAGVFLADAVLAHERESDLMFHADRGSNSVRRIGLNASGTPINVEEIPLGGEVRNLLSGTGLVLTLLEDGSIGWLIP